MSNIIVTNSDCTLSTPNAFFRVEDSNTAFIPTTTGTSYLALSSFRYINLTPANAGNYGGCGIAVYSTVAGDRSLTIDFQEGQTATLAIASPGVVGLVAHGFAVGTGVQFTTAGTLPTGVVSNTVYYARNTDCVTPANEFWLYGTQAQAIAGGTTGRINFTGSSSGTHTCWVVRATESKTWETIRGGFTSPAGATSQDKLGVYLVDMHAPSSNYTFTTTAGCWRLRCYQSGGSTGTLNIWYNNTLTLYPFWFYSNTQVSFNNGDTPIFAHYCDIDQTANFNGVLGTGETARGCAGIICSNDVAQTVDDVSYLTCLTPAASYTLTLNGLVYTAGHSAPRFGTSAVPIPKANRFILNTGAGTVGTQRGAFYTLINAYSVTLYYGSRSSFFAYGEHPTIIRTSLAQDSATLGAGEGQTYTMSIANPCVVTRTGHGFVGNEPVIFTTTGQLPTGGTTNIVAGQTYYVKYVNANTFRLSATPGGADISTAGGSQSGIHFMGAKSTIVTTDDVSDEWEAGDTIVVGKQEIRGVGSVYQMTIESIIGTSITFTHILPGYKRLSGGSVINMTPSKYGVNLVDTGINTLGYAFLPSANNINIEGCYLKGFYVTGVSARVNDDDASVNIQTQTFKNSVCQNNGTQGLYCFYNLRLPRLGLTINNAWGHVMIPAYCSFPPTATATYKSGTFTMNNVGVLSRSNYYFGIATKCLVNISNIYMENGVTTTSYAFVANIGAGSVIDGVYIYGENNTTGTFAVTAVSINSIIKNIYITNCANALVFLASAIVFGLKFENVVCSGNTQDLRIDAGAYVSAVFKNCNGITTKSYADLTYTTDGTKLSFVNYEDVANADFSETTWGIFTRTGGNLTDTTTHTVGSDKYAIRFQNSIQGVPLEWISSVPTGDIQNKELVIGVWCKINSANYYSASYTKPRLTVSYDDGASNSYTEASNTTDWQFLIVRVTPTTTFGQVTVTMQSDTDQAGSDAYVYYDDASVFYPPGVQLSLGGFDLWSNGYPIVPFIATNVNASDVWSYPKASATASGSMGEMEVITNQSVDDTQALVISTL
jgi:hypothetical protein